MLQPTLHHEIESELRTFDVSVNKWLLTSPWCTVRSTQSSVGCDGRAIAVVSARDIHLGRSLRQTPIPVTHEASLSREYETATVMVPHKRKACDIVTQSVLAIARLVIVESTRCGVGDVWAFLHSQFPKLCGTN